MSKRLTLFNYDWLELDEFNHGQEKESMQKLQVVLTADTLEISNMEKRVVFSHSKGKKTWRK